MYIDYSVNTQEYTDLSLLSKSVDIAYQFHLQISHLNIYIYTPSADAFRIQSNLIIYIIVLINNAQKTCQIHVYSDWDFY